MERGAQIGGKDLIAFRGRVRTNTTEVSTGCSHSTPECDEAFSTYLSKKPDQKNMFSISSGN